MPNPTMKLGDLVSAIADKTGQSATVVKAVLEAEMAVASHELLRGTDVPVLNGAIKLSVAERAARSGRNPLTGEEITIAAKKVVKAKVGKKLQDIVA